MRLRGQTRGEPRWRSTSGVGLGCSTIGCSRKGPRPERAGNEHTERRRALQCCLVCPPGPTPEIPPPTSYGRMRVDTAGPTSGTSILLGRSSTPRTHPKLSNASLRSRTHDIDSRFNAMPNAKANAKCQGDSEGYSLLRTKSLNFRHYQLVNGYDNCTRGMENGRD